MHDPEVLAFLLYVKKEMHLNAISLKSYKKLKFCRLKFFNYRIFNIKNLDSVPAAS